MDVIRGLKMMVILMFHVSLCAVGSVPLASVESLLKVLDLLGPGVALEAPPPYMLGLYSDVALGPGRSNPPYGATAVTAVTAAEGKGNTFFFHLPNISKWDKLVEVEFHLHHAHITNPDVSQLVDGAMLKVYASVEGSREKHTQLLLGHAAGWIKFRMGITAIPDLHSLCEEDQQQEQEQYQQQQFSSQNQNSKEQENKQDEQQHAQQPCVKSFIAISMKVTTMEGRPVPIRLHHGNQMPERKSLLIFFTKSEVRNAFAPLLSEFSDMPRDRIRRSLLPNYDNNATSVGQQSSSGLDSSSCSRTPLTVNFQEIGWSSWVLHPAEYNAYYCTGRCGFPLGQHLNPTNHAVVQSIMRVITGEHIPMPCCVPRSYSNLALLYHDPDGNVVFRNYADMVVDSCGCQ